MLVACVMLLLLHLIVLSKLLNNYKMSLCDDLLVAAISTGYTYLNEALWATVHAWTTSLSLMN